MTARAEATTQGTIYRPEHLKIMIAAFDAAWGHIQRRPEIGLQQVYRHRLADAVVRWPTALTIRKRSNKQRWRALL